MWLIDRMQGGAKALLSLVSLAILIGLILFGLSNNPTATTGTPQPNAPVVYNDLSFYRDVIADMRGGAGYYDAAIKEARKNNYPLHPFVTVRFPTLAWLLSSTSSDAVGWGALMALALATLLAWARKLRLANLTRPQYAFAVVCLTTGIFQALIPTFALFHETWAGLLIALSLAVRRKDAWIASVLVGLAAALTRELAGAYLLAMAAMALEERNFRELTAWIAAIAIVAIALIVHAFNVNALVTGADFTSPGWIDFGGWLFVLNTAQFNVVLSLAPAWTTAIVLPLALFGLTAPQTDRRLQLVVAGYVTTFLIAGRSDNVYWGLLIAPLWPIGLAGAGPALDARVSDIGALFATMRGTPSVTRAGWQLEILAVLIGIVTLLVLF